MSLTQTSPGLPSGGSGGGKKGDNNKQPPKQGGAQSKDESAATCAICLEGNCDMKLFPCGHIFHWACLIQNINTPNGRLCPNCRQAINDWYDLENGHWVYNG